MRTREIRIIGSVLGNELGWLWPIFLVKCLSRKKGIFNRTHWAESEDQESKFAERLSLSAAIYLGLAEKLGKDRAFEAMRRSDWRRPPLGVRRRNESKRELRRDTLITKGE